MSHKRVAEAAGLGRTGIHRNLSHPRFGNLVLLGTVLLNAEVSAYGRPLEYTPCLECKLCVSACPVRAISTEGRIEFSARYTHDYREFRCRNPTRRRSSSGARGRASDTSRGPGRQ